MGSILKYIIVAVIAIFAVNESNAQFYNGSDQSFGKNRVQYSDFAWNSYDFEDFKIYFYSSGKNHAIYTAKSAHKSLGELMTLLDVELRDKLEIVVFNNLSHFRQSNIGLRNDEESNVGGVTHIVGSKMFVYYEGDHAALDAQIKSGLAQVMVHQMMYGGNWKDVIKNNTLLSLPDWFAKGFVSYAGKGWNVDIDNRVKDGIMSGRFKNFNSLSREDSELAGHAIWNYIAEVYGENALPNLLYMTRVSRKVESGMLFVLGTSMSNLMRDYDAYYKRKYELDEKFKDILPEDNLEFKRKDKYAYSQFKLSPNGKHATFVTHEKGQYKIWLYNRSDKTLKKIAKGGLKIERLNDRSYPIVAWHPTSKAITYFEERTGETQIGIYSINSKKTVKKPILRIDKVLDANYSDDGKFIILSAASLGQTDLFLYKVTGNSVKQLTNDIYDDLNASFIDKSTRVIFSSNRVSDTLPKKGKIVVKPYSNDLDIYILDLKRPVFLTRITETKGVNETQPFQYDSTRYAYLSNSNGITNRYLAYYDSTISHIDTTIHYNYFSVTSPITNYPRNILEHQINWKKDAYTQLVFKDGAYQFITLKKSADKLIEEDNLYPTQYRKNFLAITEPSIIHTNPNEESDTSSHGIDIDNYKFEDDQPTYEKETISFEDPIKTDSTKTSEKPLKKKEKFELPRQDLYNVNFTTDYIVSQLDNSFLNQSYQRFAPGVFYSNPGFNGMLKIGLIDLMEDYRIIGGVRFPANFNSNEYLVSYENLKRRLDKKYLISRQAFTRFYEPKIEKVQTYDAKATYKWPFSEVSAISGTANIRVDRIITKATEQSSLAIPNNTDYWAGAKIEYVYDNTSSLGLNLLEGLRMKFWGEAYLEPLEKKSDFFTLGGDIRHYTKVWRNMIWANRLSGNTSFGNRKLVHYLGGVNHWLTPKFDDNIYVDPDNGYYFQTIATPMRGFFQNGRNGNSFVAINSEIRMPIIKMLSWKPMKSDFAENFMLVAFGDIGAAWTGWDPYSLDNSFNTTIIGNGNLTITLENQKEPIIYGYGVGARSRLFGYYIRVDVAWGVDDGVVLKPLTYLSLTKDF